MIWSSSSGRIELRLTKAQAHSASHQGRCDDDVDALVREPVMARQLAKLQPEMVAAELREYGAWDQSELADHDANLRRLVWCAAGDIVDGRS